MDNMPCIFSPLDENTLYWFSHEHLCDFLWNKNYLQWFSLHKNINLLHAFKDFALALALSYFQKLSYKSHQSLVWFIQGPVEQNFE